MFHTNLVMSYHVSHISGRAAPPYHLLTPTADFSWLIAIISTYYSVAIVYIMASQDLISQFSQDTNAIPASQPDRSRTPHRPQHGWHQNGTYVSRTDAFCNDDPSSLLASCWHTSSTTDVHIVSHHAQHGLSPHHLFHLHRRRSLNNLSTTPILHLNDNPLTPRSPRPMSSPGGSSAINEGYTCRPIEIPPVEQWKPDVDFHDSNKINGLDFPSRIRQSRFSSYKDIEGMDPLQVPLWKFLYQDLHNTWLRRVAYGRENLRPSLRQHRHHSIRRRIGLATTHPECGFGQVSYFQITFGWPMCEPKGSYPEHGQRSCPAAPILATSSTIRGRGQSAAHS